MGGARNKDQTQAGKETKNTHSFIQSVFETSAENLLFVDIVVGAWETTLVKQVPQAQGACVLAEAKLTINKINKQNSMYVRWGSTKFIP